MKKEELSQIKKGFKVDGKREISVSGLINIYCKFDGGKTEIKFISNEVLARKNVDERELYYNNFKKLISGSFGKNLFELDFQSNPEGKESQEMLCELKDPDNFEIVATELVEKILKTYSYGKDVVFSAILGTVFLSEGKGKLKTTVNHTFVCLTVNEVGLSSKELSIDTVAKQLTERSNDVVVNFNKPIEGFMFPSLTDLNSDVNKLIYCTGKANVLNPNLIEEVLSCKKVLTAVEEKNVLNCVLKEAIGDAVELEKLSSIYTDIADYKTVSNTNISSDELKDILESNGIKDVKDALAKTIGTKPLDLNIDNIIPTGKKALKINNDKVTVALDTELIKNVSQSKKVGKNCLIIELSEDIDIDGFKISKDK